MGHSTNSCVFFDVLKDSGILLDKFSVFIKEGEVYTLGHYG